LELGWLRHTLLLETLPSLLKVNVLITVAKKKEICCQGQLSNSKHPFSTAEWCKEVVELFDIHVAVQWKHKNATVVVVGHMH
jgi:hypothetical protein